MYEYPKQIKEFIVIPEITNSYTGYLYKFTNLDKLKYYIGSRKGLIEDHNYWHSSTCDEFQRDLANPNANFKFEVLEVGKHNVIEVLEDKMLKDVKAGQNPSYYNKQSGGSPKYRISNLQACEQLRDDILSGKYKSETEKEITDLMKMIDDERFFQVRLVTSPEKIGFVRDKVDDNAGNTELCQIVVLENRRNGEDVVVDGNHTIRGINASKHGKRVFIHLVPEKIHSLLDDQEITILCGLLNPQKEFQEDPISPIETVEKVLMGEIKKGVDIKDQSLRDIVKSIGFGGRQISYIIGKLDKQIAKEKHKDLYHKTIIDYNVEPAKSEVKRVVESLKNSETMAVHLTTGMWKGEEWIKEVYRNREIADKTKLCVVITHPMPTMSKNFYDIWHKQQGNVEFDKIKFFLEGLKKVTTDKDGNKIKKDYTLRFHEMPYDVPNAI